MKIDTRTITTIAPPEGALLRRKVDGWMTAGAISLGYNYYEADVPLAGKKLETPEDYEVVAKPEGWEEKPVIDQDRRLTRFAQLIEEEKREFKNRNLTPAQMIAHRSFAPKWGEDIKEGDAVGKGDKFTYEDKLYAVMQDHTVSMAQYPSIYTASLYCEVTPDYNEDGEVNGTKENPIAYSGNMALENGKFYSQDNVVYLCTRDTGVPVYNALADLVGIYVEVA